MKKKKGIIILLILILIIVVLGTWIINKKKVEISKPSEFSKVTIQTDEEIRESIIYSNYITFKSDVKSNITEEDFKNHNYLLIPIQIDPCSEENVRPTDYQITNNQIKIKVEYTAKCGVCAPEVEYFILPIEKNINSLKVDLNYKAMNDPHCNPNVAYKPMIYLYPKEKTEVKVTLKNKELLTTTYPKYNNSWIVTAYPDGTLIDENKNREYYGLYWEGKSHYGEMKEEGFVIPGEQTSTFLEEKLRVLGLTDKEANEFIVYWLPKLEYNPYNYIYFETEQEINSYMPMDITPKPDNIIRIFMDYKPLEEKIKVKEQSLITPDRVGFTVIEWGGSIIQ